MLETLRHFLNMGGYGIYVWSAYGSVILCLLVQWLIPHYLWRKYLRK